METARDPGAGGAAKASRLKGRRRTEAERREDRARLRDLTERGFTIREIAAELRTSEKTVIGDLASCGLRTVQARAGDANNHRLLTSRRAAKLTGLSRHTIDAAIDNGRLVAKESPAGKDPRSGRLVAREDLEAFVAALDPCRFPGCDQLGVTPGGFCGQEHAAAATALDPDWGRRLIAGIRAFWDSPESESERSRRRELRTAENRVPAWRRSLWAFYDSPAGLEERARRSASARQRALGAWDEVTGIALGFLNSGRATGPTRQRHLGRRTLRKHHAVGKKGEKKGREVAGVALQLLEQRPDLNRRSAIDALIVHFHGASSVKVDGRRRTTGDLEYRKARARIERALARGYDLLGRPAALKPLV